MNIGYSRKCDNVKAIVWHRSFNSAIIFPLYATIDHLTLSSLLSPVSWSRNNADRDKTDVVVRPWWPIRKLELLSRTKHAWLLNPVAMVNQRRPRIRKNHAERSRAQEIDYCLIDWKGHNLAEKIAIRNPFLLLLLLCQFYKCTAFMLKTL